MFGLSMCFLYFSIEAGDNEVLKLLGEDKTNAKFERKAQYMFIGISFVCIIMGSLAVSSAYSQEHAITYVFGYTSLIMSLTFAAVGLSFYVLHNNIQSDFAKECNSKTGIAYTIDQIYEQGTGILCSEQCPCNIGHNNAEYKGKKYADMSFDK